MKRNIETIGILSSSCCRRHMVRFSIEMILKCQILYEIRVNSKSVVNIAQVKIAPNIHNTFHLNTSIIYECVSRRVYC